MLLPMFSLAVYVHSLNPIAVPLPDWWFLPAGIRWYGLSYLLGFVIAYFMIRRVTRVGISTVQPVEVGDLIVTMAVGVVLGGRLGYVMFYMPSLWGPTDPFRFPYWGVLAINQGGMASHGGMIGAVLGAGWYAWRSGGGKSEVRNQKSEVRRPKARDARRNTGANRAAAGDQSATAARVKHSWAHILDLAAFGTPIGLFFGRIANFINGELYGRACPENFPLAVKFPQEMLGWSRDHVDRLRPVFDLLPKGELSLGGDPVVAVIRQIQHGNHALRDAVAPLLTPRYPSQLFEAVLEGLVLMALLVIVWVKPRKPLVLGGWFCLGYAVARIVVECFREPDPQIGYLMFHTTEGQWLSAGLFLAGILIIVLATRRNVAPMGGWRKV
jgi:phosphatidylglycerol---prolipoprotein diacylglyceryl transferase